MIKSKKYKYNYFPIQTSKLIKLIKMSSMMSIVISSQIEMIVKDHLRTAGVQISNRYNLPLDDVFMLLGVPESESRLESMSRDLIY